IRLSPPESCMKPRSRWMKSTPVVSSGSLVRPPVYSPTLLAQTFCRQPGHRAARLRYVRLMQSLLSFVQEFNPKPFSACIHPDDGSLRQSLLSINNRLLSGIELLRYNRGRNAMVVIFADILIFLSSFSG